MIQLKNVQAEVRFSDFYTNKGEKIPIGNIKLKIQSNEFNGIEDYFAKRKSLYTEANAPRFYGDTMVAGGASAVQFNLI